MTLKLIDAYRRIEQATILDGINLEVQNGECLALLGPSGCGKSSTLRVIAGLDKLNRGRITINNKDITNKEPSERKVGMVFQSYALFPHLTIHENLSIGLKIRGETKNKQFQKVEYVLGLMQLEKYANRKPSDLSGGQRQRVALARALLREPLVYLLDEPMSNLDAQLREELRPELRKIILSKDNPIIYVTHDQHEAMAMASRIGIMKEGRIEQVGTPQELYKEPNSLFVAGFIGRPQINFLPVEGNLIKAIRPEDIEISNEGLNARVIYREWLGNSQLLIVESIYGEIRIVVDSNQIIHENIKLIMPKNKMHQFSSADGKRIYN